MATQHEHEHEENEEVPDQEQFIGDDAAEEVQDDGDAPMDEDDGPGGEGEGGEGEEIVWEDNSVMVSTSISLRSMSTHSHTCISPSLHMKSPSSLYLGTQRSH